MKFQIRDLVWATLVVALIVGMSLQRKEALRNARLASEREAALVSKLKDSEERLKEDNERLVAMTQKLLSRNAREGK